MKNTDMSGRAETLDTPTKKKKNKEEEEEEKARPTFLLIPRRTPEEHFRLQLIPKQRISLSRVNLCVLLQKAPISQS